MSNVNRYERSMISTDVSSRQTHVHQYNDQTFRIVDLVRISHRIELSLSGRTFRIDKIRKHKSIDRDTSYGSAWVACGVIDEELHAFNLWHLDIISHCEQLNLDVFEEVGGYEIYSR